VTSLGSDRDAIDILAFGYNTVAHREEPKCAIADPGAEPPYTPPYIANEYDAVPSATRNFPRSLLMSNTRIEEARDRKRARSGRERPDPYRHWVA